MLSLSLPFFSSQIDIMHDDPRLATRKPRAIRNCLIEMSLIEGRVFLGQGAAAAAETSESRKCAIYDATMRSPFQVTGCTVSL